MQVNTNLSSSGWQQINLKIGFHYFLIDCSLYKLFAFEISAFMIKYLSSESAKLVSHYFVSNAWILFAIKTLGLSQMRWPDDSVSRNMI